MARVVPLAVAAGLFLSAPALGQGTTTVSEGFDDVSTLAAAGWSRVNRTPNPNPTGAWRQGSSLGGGTEVFTPQAGAAGSYARSDYFATTNGVGGGAVTVSDWLILPTRTVSNGATLSFWTRTTAGGLFPERLVVRLSTAGASANVGAGPDDVGDFTTTLLTINPSLATGTTYPNDWTQFTLTVSGLSGPTDARLAFQHYVTNSGPDGLNGDQLALDTVLFVPVPEPAGLLLAAGLAVVSVRRRFRAAAPARPE